MARVAYLDGSSSSNDTGRGSADQSGKPCTSAVYGRQKSRRPEHKSGARSRCRPTQRDSFALQPLQLRQYDSLLCLVFSFTVGIAGFADFVRLEENDLAKTFISVNARRQGRAVGNFQGHEAFPLRLKRGHVDDDAATGISALAYADGQYAAGNLEVFHGPRKGK